MLNTKQNIYINFPHSDHHSDTVKLDCTLLVMAGIGVYVYGMFSIMGSVFALQDGLEGEIKKVFFLTLN